jgi:hypothetical protein
VEGSTSLKRANVLQILGLEIELAPSLTLEEIRANGRCTDNLTRQTLRRVEDIAAAERRVGG